MATPIFRLAPSTWIDADTEAVDITDITGMEVTVEATVTKRQLKQQQHQHLQHLPLLQPLRLLHQHLQQQQVLLQQQQQLRQQQQRQQRQQWMVKQSSPLKSKYPTGNNRLLKIKSVNLMTIFSTWSLNKIKSKTM